MLLFQYKFVKNCQNFFSIGIHAPKRVAKVFFVTPGLEPLVQQRPRDIYVAAQVLGRVAAQEETVEYRCFPLWRQRIKIVTAYHDCVLLKTVSYY